MSEQIEWVTLARIVRPQGRRGEVLCDLLTDFPEQLTGYFSLLSFGEKRSTVHVEEHWLPTGRNAGRIVLKLTDVDSITQAEALVGSEVQIPANLRTTLEQGTYYISDLIGCTLMDGEASLGTIEDVQAAHDSNGRKLEDAAPLFVLRRNDGDEVLIPFANEFVRRIDIKTKVIEMALPHGLVELNG